MVTKYVMMFGTYFQSSTMAISCFLTVQRFGDERQSMPRFFFLPRWKFQVDAERDAGGEVMGRGKLRNLYFLNVKIFIPFFWEPF